MGRSDAAIRRCWQEWVDKGKFQRHGGRGRPRTTADWEDTLIVISAVTAPDSSLSTIKRCNHVDWGPIVFNDESCFQLCHDYQRRLVWRRPGQHANPAFIIAPHTGPRPGVMVGVPFILTDRPLWSSLEAHLQHNGNVDCLAGQLNKFGKKYPRRPSGGFITLCHVVWQLAFRLEVGQHLIELITL
ncbi:HTH_Tnp_Tc3_2 domain-containing protein [Trichonephila clavipes]|nr:HTH_Tnp_Tc3_2 domain-containing protein [Trichonephila clavipes]